MHSTVTLGSHQKGYNALARKLQGLLPLGLRRLKALDFTCPYIETIVQCTSPTTTQWIMSKDANAFVYVAMRFIEPQCTLWRLLRSWSSALVIWLSENRTRWLTQSPPYPAPPPNKISFVEPENPRRGHNGKEPYGKTGIGGTGSRASRTRGHSVFSKNSYTLVHILHYNANNNNEDNDDSYNSRCTLWSGLAVLGKPLTIHITGRHACGGFTLLSCINTTVSITLSPTWLLYKTSLRSNFKNMSDFLSIFLNSTHDSLFILWLQARISFATANQYRGIQQRVLLLYVNENTCQYKVGSLTVKHWYT